MKTNHLEIMDNYVYPTVTEFIQVLGEFLLHKKEAKTWGTLWVE